MNGMDQTLSNTQQMLLEALTKQDAKLGQMYEGAVLVFKSSNPDRLRLTAHGIRELINELPGYLDVVIEDEAKQRLGDFAANLLKTYEALRKKTPWPGNPKWEGQIDEHLRGFLTEVESFLEADGKIKSSRANKTRGLIQKQNHNSVQLPKPIEDHKVKEWKIYSDFFTGRAHQASTTHDELLEYLCSFEDLLLHYLRPQTRDRQKEILEKIKEGEANGN
jgi:hypothetical protein